MHELYELKEMLCKELEEIGGKGELTAGSLETVDTLAHALKNVDKIIETKEESEGYSGNYSMNRSYARGGNYANRSYRNSYARGRGSNARRDSMGRYSSNDGYSMADDMVSKLYEVMEDAPDEQTRKDIQRIITKMEQM